MNRPWKLIWPGSLSWGSSPILSLLESIDKIICFGNYQRKISQFSLYGTYSLAGLEYQHRRVGEGMALLTCHTGTQRNPTHRWPSRCADSDPYLSLNELTYLWGLCVFWESHLSWGRLRTPFKGNLIYLEKSVCAPSTIFLCTIPWTGWWNRQFQAKALFWDTCLQITGHEIQVSRMPGKRDYDAFTMIGWGREGCLHTCVRQIPPSSRNKERLSD